MTTTAMALVPDGAVRRGLNEAAWNALSNSVYPGARPESILLAVDYCAARHLDPLKKPVHIVPMEVRNAKTNQYEWRDVILPGIFEHRTTAQRTGLYLGHSTPEYGPEIEFKGIKAPEWCAMTMYRHNKWATNLRVEFPVRVYFREVVALNKDGKPNARWTRAPIQMLEKNTEAKGLREAFPEELGGMVTEEEMEGQRAIDAPVAFDEVIEPALPKPEGYDEWLLDLAKVSDEGTLLLREAWKNAPQPCREYLRQVEPTAIDTLKQHAVLADATKREQPAADADTIPRRDDDA